MMSRKPRSARRKPARTAKATGTITDLDDGGHFGVIDADDGRLVLFNLRGIDPSLYDRFKVGSRVEFVAEESELAPRAQTLRPCEVHHH